MRILAAREGKRRLSTLLGCGGSEVFIHLLLLARTARQMANFAARFRSTSYKRIVGDAADSILSTYRAIVLSLAGEACPARWLIQWCLRIPSEIPSRHCVSSETVVDDEMLICRQLCLQATFHGG